MRFWSLSILVAAAGCANVNVKHDQSYDGFAEVAAVLRAHGAR